MCFKHIRTHIVNKILFTVLHYDCHRFIVCILILLPCTLQSSIFIIIIIIIISNGLLSESIMFYVDLREGEPEDAEDIIKKSIEEIHESARCTLQFRYFSLFLMTISTRFYVAT